MKCHSLVLKVASRCNLNCTYCYMYNLGDTTYKNQPKFMSNKVINALFKRVKIHCLKNNITKFTFNFHGGEPLLAGRDFFRNFINKAKKALEPSVKVVFNLQTNGVLITDEWCIFFKEFSINVGISMDGTKSSHDMYRVDHAGRGSYDDVVKGIKKYKEYFPRVGVISVLNYDANPIEIYENFKEIGISGYNILLLDYIYETRPKYLDDYENAKNTPIGDWLIRLFDAWFYDTEKQKPSVELFNTFINLILGLEKFGNEVHGERNNEVLVIETNGGIEVVGSLKACGNGFTKAGINVLNNEIDDAFDTDLAKAYHYSHKNLCKQCNVCPIKKICGGGYLVHRYSRKNGFNNPSLYCKDLMKIITHIQNTLFRYFPESFLKEANLSTMYYDEVRGIIRERLKQKTENYSSSFLENFKESSFA